MRRRPIARSEFIDVAKGAQNSTTKLAALMSNKLKVVLYRTTAGGSLFKKIWPDGKEEKIADNVSWQKEPMGDFRDLYYQNPIVDSLRELFITAWMAYHSAADSIDGHIRYPHTRSEHELCNKAALAGARAQKRVLEEAHYDSVQLLHDAKAHQLWNAAKLEALRRLGK